MSILYRISRQSDYGAIMSMQRDCIIYLAIDSNWYVRLACDEYGGAFDINAEVYGPFNSRREAVSELNNHANPGGWIEDGSGIRGVDGRKVKR